MNAKIMVSGEEIGVISYKSLAAYRYLFNVCGLEVIWNPNQNTIQLESPLQNKTVFLKVNDPYGNWKETFLEKVPGFLKGYGINVISENEQDSSSTFNLGMELSVMTEEFSHDCLMEITHNFDSNDAKCLALFREEFQKEGINLTVKKIVDERAPFLSVQIKYLKVGDKSFRSQLGENISMILAMGVLSHLLGDAPLSPLSLVFGTNPFQLGLKKNSNPKNDDHEPKITKKTQELTEQNEEEVLKAEVYFDSHVILDKEGRKKIKVLGNLHIKNTGAASLINPVVCFRITPAGSTIISGQIVPPKAVGIMGMFNAEGPKGWMYMNEDWLKQAMEKGELWMAPIGRMSILPGQTESIKNLQMELQNSEEINRFLVEGFVIFNEQQLKLAANNRISISFIE